MEIVTDAVDGGSGRRLTALERVLRTHGRLCVCAGGCGTEHESNKCEAGATAKSPMLAAPHPLPLTEHETAAAPVEALRPWCAPCWRRARKRAAEAAVELPRQELAEAQTALPAELFAGGGR
ncbi:hypothetical protein ACF1FX_34585 [Streptomyces sp. NPDC014646]|uniref:hypothetical protein n=1 Tax=Streptomyces sp. NPDC014646 TaxID=3364877 RepID=UPI0036FBCA5E